MPKTPNVKKDERKHIHDGVYMEHTFEIFPLNSSPRVNAITPLMVRVNRIVTVRDWYQRPPEEREAITASIQRELVLEAEGSDARWVKKLNRLEKKFGHYKKQ